MILSYCTRHTSIILEINGVGCWNIFLSNQDRKEKQLLEENISNPMLQLDTYLQEVQKTFLSLIGICDTLNAFNLLSLLLDQVKLLEREITRKDKAMAFAWVTLSGAKVFLSSFQEDIENLNIENASLA